MNHQNTNSTDIQPKPMRRLKIFYLFVFLSVLLIVTLFIQKAHGAQITLAWDASTDSRVTGYKIYWGIKSNQYALLADVGKSTNETISDLQAGTTYYFAATAYNAQGVESGYSNEVSYSVPTGCTYTISPTGKTFTQAGGAGTVSVTTQSTCRWTASSSVSWITISSGSSGTGSGTVYYSVSGNTGTAARASASTIAGQAFTVTQSGTQNCTLTITKSGTGSGTVTNNPSGTAFVAGASITLTATPSSGSTFAGWSGACSGTSSTCTVTMNGNLNVGASFAANTVSYIISASAGTGGSISPSGSVSVNKGASQTFAITSNSGYRLWYLKIDGKTRLTSAASYTFSNVQSKHTISAYFRRK